MAHKIINGIQADKIEQEYKAVCTPNTAQMKHFKRQDTKLQEFWFDLLGNEYPNLNDFLKKVFILSHGNAALERGFSVNKECLVENLNEKSLIPQRIVYDSILELKGLENISIEKELILSARNAYSRYQEDLKQRKIEDDVKKEKREEKRKAAQAIKELQNKKMKIMEQATKEASVIEEK